MAAGLALCKQPLHYFYPLADQALRSNGKRSGKTADWEPWSRVLPQEVGRVYEMIIPIIGDRRLQLRASEGRPEYFVL